MIFWFKSCPRCGGDLYKEKDVYGAYIACLQCGHYLTPTEEVAWYGGGITTQVASAASRTSRELAGAGASGASRDGG